MADPTQTPTSAEELVKLVVDMVKAIVPPHLHGDLTLAHQHAGKLLNVEIGARSNASAIFGRLIGVEHKTIDAIQAVAEAAAGHRGMRVGVSILRHPASRSQSR